METELELESESPDLTSLADPDDTQEPLEEPIEAVAQEPEEVVEEVSTPLVDSREYASPFAGIQPTGELPDQLKELFDPSVYAAIERMATEIADKRIAAAQMAQSQSRAAARQIGLTDEQADHFEVSRYEPMVPVEHRGTKQGAAIALSMSIADKLMRGGTVDEVLGGIKPRQMQQVATKSVIPPEQRMTSPRTTTTVRAQPSASKSPFSYLEKVWGADSEQIKAIREASE